MDETAFWSTALGEWIRDCFCGTSNVPSFVPSVERWRYRTSNGPSSGDQECRRTSDGVLPEITYRQLCDGYALNRLFQEIRSMDDPYFNEILSAAFVDYEDSSVSGSGGRILSTTSRLRLFHLLLRNLSNFYRDNSLCIVSLPNTISIVKHPVPETSGNEMLKLVGLLLGAAVQADRRELFIDRIKALDSDVQHRLISEIQRVTTSGDTVLRIEDLNLLTKPSLKETGLSIFAEVNGDSAQQQLLVADDAERRRLLTALVDGLTRERDHYASAILEMLEEVVEPDELLHPEASGRVAAGSEEPCSSSSASSAESSTSSSSAITTITATTAGGNNSDHLRHNAETEADDFESGFESGGGGTISAAALKTASSSTLSLTAVASAAAVAAAVEANAAEHRHVSVELASAKAELRKLRVENEHKEELMLDLQEELEKRDAQVARLQAERLELVRDARAAKDYRDEIDCMQHKLMKLERLEAENEKLRARLTEMNYYKSQVNSLREDNDTVQETCRILEEQVEQGQRKLAAYLELEGRMIESQASVKSLQLDLAKTRERVEDLLVENGRLERECKQHAQTCGELERRIAAAADASSPRGETLSATTVVSRRGSNNLVAVNACGGYGNGSDHPAPNDSSLLAQLDACNQSQILALELENRKLKSQLESLNDNNNPAEMFELRAELTAAERLLNARCEEVTRLIAQLDAATVEHADAERERDELRREVAVLTERNAAAAVESGVERSGLQQQMADQTDRLKQKVSDIELDLAARDEQLVLLRAEKTQAEAQLERMCAQLRDARAQLDVAEEARRRAVDAADAAERQRRAADAERAALKTRCATTDDRLAEASVRALNAENAERRLADAQRQLVEKADALMGAESETRALKQQMELETRKTQRLREELVGERSRLADLLSRLRSVCTVAAQTNRSAASAGQPDVAEKSETEEVDDDARLIANIDEILMRALSTARREADALRIQQQVQIRELDDLKKDIEGLRKVESELNASDGKYSETLLENRNIKEQVTLLQDRLRRVQLDEATRAAELQAARHEVDDLQRRMFSHGRQSAELVNVQLTLRHAQVQEELLRNENAELRAKLDSMMAERNEALHSSEALSAVNTALAADHDRLQSLHQALAADYERARNENNALKQRLKADKNTVESGLRTEFGRERSVLEEKLKQEMAERQHLYRRLVDCEAELARTANELAELRRGGAPSSQENQSGGQASSSSTANEIRRLRLLECAQKSTINNLNMTIQQLNNVLTEKDLEIVNLRRQIDMLRQYNGDESRSLIRQIELLLIQNQQLHTRSDAFYAEQKELQEKLATLRRHKEKLEEKIMDQYKAMDSRKVEPKPTLVRRAARALIAKSPGRKPKSVGERPETRNSADGSCGAGNGTSSNTEDSSIYSADEILPSAGSTTNATADGSGGGHSPPPPPAPIPPPAINQNGCSALNGASGPGTPKKWMIHHQQQLDNKTQGANIDAQPSTTSPSVKDGGNGLYSSLSHTRATKNGSTDGTTNSTDALPNCAGSMLRARNGRGGGSLRYPSTNPRQPPPLRSVWPLGNGFLSNGSASAFAGRSSGEDPLRHDEQIHIGYYEEREVCSPQPTAASANASATFVASVDSPSASTASPVQRQQTHRAQPNAPHRRLGSVDSACPAAASLTTAARPPPPPYPATANRSPSMNGSAAGGGSCRRSGSISAATPPPPYPGRMAGGVGSPSASMKRNNHPPPPSSLPPTPPVTTLRNATPPVVPVGFFPRDTSTPKGGDGGGKTCLRPTVAADVLPDVVAAEGADRVAVRDAAERHEKAMSVYENVTDNGNRKSRDETQLNRCTIGRSQTRQKPTKADASPASGNELGRNGSKIWYEYGCV